MLKQFCFYFFSFFYLHSFGQETFPTNGVATEFEPIYAFINAHIIDAENEIPNGTLLIQGNKILQADTGVQIPKNAIIKDLKGDYIYPSFIDLNTQYGLPKTVSRDHSFRPQYNSNKKGAFHWNQAIHPEVIAINNFQNDNKKAISFRSIGFGAVLTHQQDGIARGTGGLVLLSNKKEHQNILIKNASAHYSFNKGNSSQKYPTSLMGSIALLRQTYLDAEWYNQDVSDFNYSFEAFNSEQDLPQIFEAKDVFDISRIYKIADEFEVDYIIIGNGDEYKELDIIKQTDFSFILPLNFPESYEVSNPEEAENISLEQLKHWETAPFNPLILANNNITFSFTSSGQKNPKDFLKILRKAIQKGLSKQDALAALTTIPAKQINAEQLLGTIKKDKYANFIICSKDIFEDGIIYENWVSGKKYVVSKKQEIDVRGYYTLNSQEIKDELVAIKGSKAKPKTTIFFLDSLALKTSLSDKEISINTKDGAFRAVGTFSDGKINGRFQDENGTFYHFSMVRDSLFKEKKKEFSAEIDSIIPEIWLPNKAYGFTKKPTAEIILFKNATLWTNEVEGVLENAEIIIKDGAIIAVGKELDLSEILEKDEIVKTIDASGKHISCGIIDEHSHIAITRGVNEGSQAVTAEVRIGDVINANDINIYRQLSGGVTASQLLHGSANPIGGQSALIKLRWGSSAEELKIEGADGFIKFALGENVKQSNWGDFNKVRFPQSRMGVEQVFYDAFYRARKYQLEWDLYNAMPSNMKRKSESPREDLELNALVEILKGERFVTCHSYVQSEINMLMHVADSMRFRINTFTHILEGYKIADKLAKHGAGGSTFSDWWAYKFEVNDAIPYNATLLNNAGVVTAINSDDAEMGRRLNQEAAKAVKYGGTTEEDAWKMVTLNPAKLLHLDEKMGSLKVGKDADIVIWSENPLSVYAKVEQTYVDGICLFDKDRDLQLREQNLQERMRIIQKMMNEKNEKKQNPKKEKEKLYHCDTLEP
ncbi:MAG: amidohydrolase family protein [Flavobacteriales bacterium]|nr:amidohydrolase family protein [Flavobacteriales bacterium]